jgi:hypothetical protein
MKADLHIKSRNGQTPYTVVIQRGQKEIIQLLHDSSVPPVYPINTLGLEAIKNRPHLQTLWVMRRKPHCKFVSSRSFQNLMNVIQNHHSLTELNLSMQNCYYWKHDLHLINKLTSLERLDLSYCNINNQNVNVLLSNRNLLSVNITGNYNVSEASADILKKLLLANNASAFLRKKLLVLACDFGDLQSTSSWSLFPLEIKLLILNLLEVPGKTREQIKGASRFVFVNIRQWKRLSLANPSKVVHLIENLSSPLLFRWALHL